MNSSVGLMIRFEDRPAAYKGRAHPPLLCQEGWMSPSLLHIFIQEIRHPRIEVEAVF